MKRRLVIIEWLDAAVHGNEEHSPDDDNLTPAKITSVGFVVKDRTKYFTIGMDDLHDGTFRSLETIPKSGITRIEYVGKT